MVKNSKWRISSKLVTITEVLLKRFITILKFELFYKIKISTDMDRIKWKNKTIVDFLVALQKKKKKPGG